VIIVQILFWICVSAIVYSYVIYPVILMLMGGFSKREERIEGGNLFGVTVIIAAYNEEKVIAQRIENCLNLSYPADQLEIIIASDGSDDGTVEIAKEHGMGRIKLLNYSDRRGKVNVLNDAVKEARNEIIVFSDANTMFAPDAIEKIVKHFQDEKIGCVCGHLQFVNPDNSNSGELEGIYWKYETLLKKMEGRRGSLLGANGAIYAVRKSLYCFPAPDTIVEDFVIPMKILEKGYEVVFEPDSIAVEETAKHIVHEKQRRIRIGAGDFQALLMLKSLLNPFRGFVALAFWSHKVLRWFAPFFMIGAFIANLVLIGYPFYKAMLILQMVFYVSAIIGQILSWSGMKVKMFNICYYFVSMNLALFLGFFKFLSGTQKVTWQRTER